MKLKITNQQVTVIEALPLVADTENVYECEYEFGDEWEGYQRTAVFETVPTGGTASTYQVVLTSNKCRIPNEIIASSGYARFGVLGTKVVGTETLRYPTIWSEKMWVDVASIGTGTPTPPTPEVYAQILANEEELTDDVEDLDTRITSAENDIDDLEATSHTHSNKSVLDGITGVLTNAWTTASTWVSTNGANILSHLADGSIHATSQQKAYWTAKQNHLTAGENITIENDVISANGGGAVSSVNGKTGAVVLDADDVGALPSSTSIPTKTSDLTNDSGFIDSSYHDQSKADANSVYTKSEIDTTVGTLQPKTDNLLSTVSKNVVGAINENKESIDNLKAIGRFLAVWNCTTGLPTTNPSTSPYTYKTGDYFLVGTVGTTNYKPNGSTYTIGVASTTVETNEVTVSDYYVYDGTDWILLKNTQKALTFANITGQPSDNSALNTALSSKVAGVKVAGTELVKDSEGKVNVPYGSYSQFGVVKASAGVGTGFYDDGLIGVQKSSDADIDDKSNNYRPIVPNNLDYAIKKGLTSNSQITSADLPSIYNTLGAVSSQGIPIATSISASSTNDEVPSAKSVVDYVEKPYELIETFTFTEPVRFERNQEPNGTPYNFRQIYLEIMCPASTDYGGNANIYINDGANSIVTMASICDSNLLIYSKLFCKAIGLKTTAQLFFGQNYEVNVGYNGSRISTANTINKITGIYVSSNLPIGTIISIYAIRN